MNHTAVNLIAAKVILGTGLVLGLTVAPHGVAHDVTVSRDDVYAFEVGDDNGIIVEDESGWDCTTMGNLRCGPTNVAGVPAGRYDLGGVPMDLWPVA